MRRHSFVAAGLGVVQCPHWGFFPLNIVIYAFMADYSTSHDCSYPYATESNSNKITVKQCSARRDSTPILNQIIHRLFLLLWDI